MSELKSRAEMAEELLPCSWGTINDTVCGGNYKCGPCQRRPAVAAALRKRDEEHARCYESLHESNLRCDALLNDHLVLESQLADEKDVRIKKENMLDTVLSDREALRAELAVLKEQNQTLWASLTAEKRHELNVAVLKGSK